ncbi:MAG TPA: rod shape-determining protein MreC [Gemmatimonadaceae bacterium]|nr:rod shape-determining protein MreC [Gemmatimonadaceae bacterium]
MPSAARAFTRRDSLLFVVSLVLSLVALGLPPHLRQPVAAALRRSVLAPLVSLQRSAELTHEAWRTREQRQEARDSVALRAMRFTDVENENAHLRRLLGLGRQLQWGFVPAEVMRAPGGAEPYAITLSAGANAGIAPYSPIVAPNGLVGMVRTVDPSMSIGIMFAHPDFRASAMSEDGSAFGIVAAHQGSDPERFLLELRGVPVRNSLAPGTLIVTSGLGGVYPRGIPLGTVLGELKTAEVWERTYLLRPTVTPVDLSSVMVLLPRRVTAGVAPVWATGRGVDSAVRSIVHAGDSLARAAVAERPPESGVERAAVPVPVTRDTARHDAPSRTPAVRPPADSGRRDTTRRETARRDTTRREAPHDTARRDTTRRDTTRRDTTRSASARPDSARLGSSQPTGARRDSGGAATTVPHDSLTASTRDSIPSRLP